MSRKTDLNKQNKKLKDHIVEQHHHLQLALQVIEVLRDDLTIKLQVEEAIQKVNTGLDFSKLRGEDMHKIAAIFNYPLTGVE